jgi:dTDP-4-dehydrorhamnose reductase
VDRVLVTGAAGYVGGEVLRVAKERGVDAIGTWHRRRLEGGLQLDVRDRSSVERLVREVRPSAIVHAAFVYGGPELWSVTAEGAGVVAAVAAEHGARLVHVSSDVVFDGSSDRRYREDDALGAVTPYAAAKVAAESLVATAHPDAAIARSALVVGGAGSNPQQQLVLEALAGAGTTFFTDIVRTPVGVTDLSHALLELASMDFAGPIHLGGDDEMTRAELAAAIARALGRSPHELRTGNAPPEVGPRCVPLDSSLAASVLTTRLRGASELVLTSPPVTDGRAGGR